MTTITTTDADYLRTIVRSQVMTERARDQLLKLIDGAEVRVSADLLEAERMTAETEARIASGEQTNLATVAAVLFDREGSVSDRAPRPPGGYRISDRPPCTGGCSRGGEGPACGRPGCY